ncbi:MAG TPA: MBL fold metallo-hydrolase [Candidatus Bathyarchaeia archaeon]|nr:MBL fold metallo-hydrolase [Candidatus Bathyarchaeia archaeon]
MKITNAVFQIDDVTGGPAVILGDKYVSLIDTGIPNSEGKIFSLIESLGRKPSDLKHILITHSDGDHIGSLHALVQATGARVYAQADEAEVIQGKRKSRGGQMVSEPVQVSQVVKDGDLLPMHGGIKVVETFGHTTGHVVYLLLNENLLLAGDCLNNVNGLAGSMPQYTANMQQAKDTVKKLATLTPESIVFGHGPPILSNAAKKLKALAESL